MMINPAYIQSNVQVVVIIALIDTSCRLLIVKGIQGGYAWTV